MGSWRRLFEFGLAIQSFAGFWMLIVVCYSGIRLTKLKDLPSIHDATYFKAGQLIICVVGAVAILYNWLPLFGWIIWLLEPPGTYGIARRRSLFIQLWIVGSLILTVGLCIGIHIQINVLPIDCNQAKTSSLLHQVGLILSSDQKFPAVAACQTLTKAWHFTLPLPIISGLTIVSGVVSFLELPLDGNWPNWRPNIVIPWPDWVIPTIRAGLSPLRFVWRCWCRFWPSGVDLCLFIVCFPLLMPLVWIIGKIKHHDKSWDRDEPSSEDSFEQIGIDLGVFNSSVDEACTSTPLEKALGTTEVFFSLASFMHGIDLHALACVSKAANMIVKNGWKHNHVFLSKRLCQQDQKLCYFCSIPVCKKCKGLAYQIRQTAKEAQRRTLQAMCSICYLFELHNLSYFNSLDQKCSGEHLSRFSIENCGRQIWICRRCSPKSTGNLRHDIYKAEKMREKFAKKSGLQLNAYNHHECFACKRRIWRTSLRWWRCVECHRECRNIVS